MLNKFLFSIFLTNSLSLLSPITAVAMDDKIDNGFCITSRKKLSLERKENPTPKGKSLTLTLGQLKYCLSKVMFDQEILKTRSGSYFITAEYALEPYLMGKMVACSDSLDTKYTSIESNGIFTFTFTLNMYVVTNPHLIVPARHVVSLEKIPPK